MPKYGELAAVRMSGVGVAVRHGPDASEPVRRWHTVLRMTQEEVLESVVRQRIRGLRLAKGWLLIAEYRRKAGEHRS